MRRWMLWLHGWIGITIGAWLAIVGLSGSVLLWRPEAEPAVQVHLRRVVPGPSQVSLQVVYDLVERAYPKQKIDRIYPPRTRGEAYELRLPKAGTEVFVDGYAGRITGTIPRGQDIFDWLDQLHVRMLAQDVGHFLVGIGGFFLLSMATSGLWLWWPRRGAWKRAFVPLLRTNWRGRTYELHRVGGAFACLVLLTCAATGITLVWAEPTRAVFSRIWGANPEAKARKGVKGKWQSLDTLVRRASATLPGTTVTRITWPKKAGGPLVVRFHLPGELNPAGNCSVSLDPVSGKVVKVEDSRRTDTVTRAMNLRYPIHTGTWGGVGTRVLYTLVGLSLPGFYISGLLMWFFRRKREKQARGRRAQREAKPETVTASNAA